MDWTDRDCRRLAGEFLSEMPERLGHVALVADSVASSCQHLPGRDLLVAAAWLHDIGYFAGIRRTGMHAIDAAEFLDRESAPVELVRLVAYHTGAEYEAEERGLTGALRAFDRPDQPLLDQLILADMTSSPTGQPMEAADRIGEILNRYEPQHPVHRAVTRSRGYLLDCCRRASISLAQPI